MSKVKIPEGWYQLHPDDTVRAYDRLWKGNWIEADCSRGNYVRHCKSSDCLVIRKKKDVGKLHWTGKMPFRVSYEHPIQALQVCETCHEDHGECRHTRKYDDKGKERIRATERGAANSDQGPDSVRVDVPKVAPRPGDLVYSLIHRTKHRVNTVINDKIYLDGTSAVLRPEQFSSGLVGIEWIVLVREPENAVGGIVKEPKRYCPPVGTRIVYYTTTSADFVPDLTHTTCPECQTRVEMLCRQWTHRDTRNAGQLRELSGIIPPHTRKTDDQQDSSPEPGGTPVPSRDTPSPAVEQDATPTAQQSVRPADDDPYVLHRRKLAERKSGLRSRLIDIARGLINDYGETQSARGYGEDLLEIIDELPEGAPFDDEPPTEKFALGGGLTNMLDIPAYAPAEMERPYVRNKPKPVEVTLDNDADYGDWQGD